MYDFHVAPLDFLESPFALTVAGWSNCVASVSLGYEPYSTDRSVWHDKFSVSGS
jgi:hypothetical protein